MPRRGPQCCRVGVGGHGGELQGVLAPGIYTTARDCMRNMGLHSLQGGGWRSPHPAQPQKVNQVVSEHQPMGLSVSHSIRPLPGVSPSSGEGGLGFQLSIARHPSTLPGPHPLDPRLRDPPSVLLEGLPQSPCPKGCWDWHRKPQGWTHATARHALLPGRGLVPGLAGPGSGLVATPASKIR